MLFHPNEILCRYWECQGYHTEQLQDREMEKTTASVTSKTVETLKHVWVHNNWIIDKVPFQDRFKSIRNIPVRLQKGCVPDQVPFGKHILSEEPISSYPSEQEK